MTSDAPAPDGEPEPSDAEPEPAEQSLAQPPGEQPVEQPPAGQSPDEWQPAQPAQPPPGEQPPVQQPYAPPQVYAQQPYPPQFYPQPAYTQPPFPPPVNPPPMNTVWSQEDPRHPAASTRRHWRRDPYWWLWPGIGVVIGLILGLIGYRIDPITSTHSTSAGTAWALVGGSAGAFLLAFLLPHRWASLWLRIPLTLAGCALAITAGGALGTVQ